MSTITEPFGAVPTRLADDLQAGELTLNEFTVLAWLELRMNYRLSPPSWRGTTADMAAAMAWPHSPRYLGRTLRDLQAKGYIERDARPRSPKPYTVRLTRGAARREGDDWTETGHSSGSVRFQSLETDSSLDTPQTHTRRDIQASQDWTQIPVLRDKDQKGLTSIETLGNQCPTPDGLRASEPDGLGASEPDGLGASEPDGLRASEPDGLRVSDPVGIGVESETPIGDDVFLDELKSDAAFLDGLGLDGEVREDIALAAVAGELRSFTDGNPDRLRSGGPMYSARELAASDLTGLGIECVGKLRPDLEGAVIEALKLRRGR